MIMFASEAVYSNTTFVELLGNSLQNPTMIVAIAIQFLLGFAAGYYMAKIAKYIVALIAVFVIGALIGAWGVSGSVESSLKALSSNWEEIRSITLQVVKLVSTVLVGPTALGFFVGLVVGIMRR